MEEHAPSWPRRVPRTNAEQKQQTRQALVRTALEVFSRDGYHAASLGAIAREAGYSKGAIYSNFRDKAELFLACMEFNLGAISTADFDPFGAGRGDDYIKALIHELAPQAESSEVVQGLQGFSLATLEFVAAVARDRRHIDALRQNFQAMIDLYAGAIESHMAEDDELSLEEVAQLMVSLDQGLALLDIMGLTADWRWTSQGASPAYGGLLRTGMRRLAGQKGPADRGAEDDRGTEPDRGTEDDRRAEDDRDTEDGRLAANDDA